MIRGHLLRCWETLENNNNDNKISNHHLYLQPNIRVVLSMVDFCRHPSLQLQVCGFQHQIIMFLGPQPF